jgi:hypothetical protein
MVRPSRLVLAEESKIMNDEPDQADDVVVSGPAKERFRFLRLALERGFGRTEPPGRQPGPNGLLVVAGALIAVLTVVVIAQAVELSGGPARVPPTAGIQQVADGAERNFRLSGTWGAILQASYVRVGHGPKAIWLTIAAPGLPRGYDGTARVGECVRGRPRTLTIYSAIPDYQTGIWRCWTG